MKKQFTLFLFFACFALSSYAQKYSPATLYFTNGKTAKMLVRSTAVNSKFVETKAEKKGKKEKIQSEDLRKIVYDVEEGDPVIYERHALLVGKKVRGPQWVQVLVEGPVSLYGQQSSMMMNLGHTVKDVTYFARRTKEDYGSYLGVDFTSGAIGIGVDKHFRKYAGEYFSDYPELVKRIENKEFEVSDVILVAQEYNKWAKK